MSGSASGGGGGAFGGGGFGGDGLSPSPMKKPGGPRRLRKIEEP